MKKLEIGDKITISGKEGEPIEGVIIDDEVYPDTRILLVQLENGQEERIEEKKIRERR